MTTKTNRPVEIGQGEVCPIWTAIIQNVGYSPHPWDIAREGTLTGVDAAVRAIRFEVARHAASAREEALREAVAWLRFDLDEWPDYVAPADIADAIERGDHLKALSIVGEGD